jgi:hypothetical protein
LIPIADWCKRVLWVATCIVFSQLSQRFDPLFVDIMSSDTNSQAVVAQLSKVQAAVAEGIVPWFTANMPTTYFRQVSYA